MPGGGLDTKVWLQDRESGQEMLTGPPRGGGEPSPKKQSLEGSTAGLLRFPDPKGPKTLLEITPFSLGSTGLQKPCRVWTQSPVSTSTILCSTLAL